MLQKIGVSLPPSVFDHKKNKSTVFQAISELGGLFEFLTWLSDIGVSSIELRAIGPHVGSNVIDPIYDLLRQHSLDLTVHSTLNYNSADEFIFSLPKEPKNDIVVVVHAIKSANDKKENYKLTVSKLEQYNNFSKRFGYPLKLVIENNRKKGILDPGDDWENIVNIVNLSSIEGACFDFGHYYYNMKHFNDNDLYLPSTEDLRIVKHTHIHGLVNDVTHFPLTATALPLNNYVSALINANYEGVYNLEISHSHFLHEIDSLKSLKDSIFLLRSAIISSYESLL